MQIKLHLYFPSFLHLWYLEPFACNKDSTSFAKIHWICRLLKSCILCLQMRVVVAMIFLWLCRVASDVFFLKCVLMNALFLIWESLTRNLLTGCVLLMIVLIVFESRKWGIYWNSMSFWLWDFIHFEFND